MNAETAAQQTRDTDAPDRPRKPAEEWVEQVAAYWGRALVAAWRTVFPPRKDTQ